MNTFLILIYCFVRPYGQVFRIICLWLDSNKELHCESVLPCRDFSNVCVMSLITTSKYVSCTVTTPFKLVFHEIDTRFFIQKVIWNANTEFLGKQIKQSCVRWKLIRIRSNKIYKSTKSQLRYVHRFLRVAQPWAIQYFSRFTHLTFTD